MHRARLRDCPKYRFTAHPAHARRGPFLTRRPPRRVRAIQLPVTPLAISRLGTRTYGAGERRASQQHGPRRAPPAPSLLPPGVSRDVYRMPMLGRPLRVYSTLMAKATESDANRRARLLAAAEEFVTRGNVAVAIREYTEMLASSPEDEVVLHRLGDLYTRIGNRDKAIEALLNLAQIHEKAGALAKAVAVNKRINKLDRTRIATY
jgi:tetratricopeptide (TPR) repeat protein